MQGKRTDYCNLRIEVLYLFPGENSAQISRNPGTLFLAELSRHYDGWRVAFGISLSI